LKQQADTKLTAAKGQLKAAQKAQVQGTTDAAAISQDEATSKAEKAKMEALLAEEKAERDAAQAATDAAKTKATAAAEAAKKAAEAEKEADQLRKKNDLQGHTQGAPKGHIQAAHPRTMRQSGRSRGITQPSSPNRTGR